MTVSTANRPLSNDEELSSSDELPGPSKRAKGKAKMQEIDNSLQVSPRQSVEEVIFIETAPECWPIPHEDHLTVAYVLDLSQTPEYLCEGRKALTMDAFIKQEVRLFFSLFHIYSKSHSSSARTRSQDQ